MNAPLRVLLIEDSATDADLIITALREAGHHSSCHRVFSAESVSAALDNGPWDIILSDFSMPAFRGIDALKLVRERDQDTPFIFVSGTIGEDIAVEAMRSGAQDYVLKHSLVRLVPAIERELLEAATRRARRATEARFQRVVDSAVIGILFRNSQGHVTDANAQFLRIVGYNREDLGTGQIDWDAMTPPEYLALDARALEEVTTTATCTPYEKEYIRKDGSRVAVIVGATRLDEPDHPTVAFVVDITERKQTENALRSRERQQAAVAKLGARAIETANLESLFTAAVQAVSETLDVRYCKVLELQHDGKTLLMRAGTGWREGIVGQARVDAGPDSQAGYTLEHNEPIVSSVLQSETRFRGSDLLQGHGIVSGVTVQIPAKVRPFGVLGAHTDHQRAFTQDDIHFLQSVAHLLGSTVQREQAEAVARQGQRLESVGSLAGGVAHDFNNLLTVIIGEAELAAGDLSPDSPAQSSLKEIVEAGHRAASLTRQLLAFSRQQMVVPRVFDLNKLVAGVEKMLHRLIGEDVEMNTRTDDQPLLVKMDPGQLEQVLVNLVVNGRDAMPDGGRLTIETDSIKLEERDRPGTPAGTYVRLTVRDSGTGMSDEVKQRVFEPFFTTKELGKGTGLGLATCYGIVTQGAGHIGIDSALGAGTTITVLLPRESDGETEVRPSGRHARRGDGEVILLVEDEEAVRRITTRILESGGYRVLQVASGEAALELLANPVRQIDLMLTDVVLRGINGRVLAERASVLRPGLKVVYASGHTGDVVLRHQVAGREMAWVNKPYTADVLLGKIREVLSNLPVN